jgi:transcription antitermination factor NusG
MHRQFQIRFRRPVEYRFPLFPRYCFVRIELQWHKIKGCPGVTTLVKNVGSDEPAHIADALIDAMKAKERDGAIDLPDEKRGRKNPRVGDQVRIVLGPIAGHSGLCTQISRQRVGVLLLMFKAHRQVRLHRDAVEMV